MSLCPFWLLPFPAAERALPGAQGSTWPDQVLGVSASRERGVLQMGVKRD